MNERDHIKIAVVLGSVRPGNYTARAAGVVVDELEKRGVTVTVLDPAKLELVQPGLGESDDSRKLKEAVESATGVVLATPEYHGSVSSVMKLAIENLGFPSVLAGKPVALLGVAAGAIGAVKTLEQLRGICSHVGAVVLPGAVSVAGVQKVFDDDGRITDERAEKRIRGLAAALLDYIDDNICPRFTLEQMAREKEGA